MTCIHEIKSAVKTSPVNSITFGFDSINELELSSQVNMTIKRCIKCGTQIFIAKPKNENEKYYLI